MDNNIYLRNNSTLTIDPGVELQFDPNTLLTVGHGQAGSLIAEGTDDENIVFTSAAATKAPGDWYGISFTYLAGSSSKLTHTVVEYAGGGNYGISIGSNSPTIDSSTIRYSSTYGIEVSGASAAPTITCNTVTANNIGIQIDNNANPTIHDNNIQGNTSYGLSTSNTTTTVNAEDNYWGASNGPGPVGPGSGDKVTAMVDFTPWLTASSPCTVPLSASFTGSPTSGCEDLIVNFTDGSTGAVDAWAWDFGDGNTSAAQHPAHTYTEPGIYTVSLTVHEGADTDTETKDGYITVAESLPTAAFTGGPLLSGPPPLSVNFTDQSSVCGNEPIVAWAWDFDNDGITDSTEQNPTEVFTWLGSYTVSLTITDSDGDSATKTAENYVYVDDVAPVADPGGPYTGVEGLAIQFDGSASYDPNGGDLTYAWDFDMDGVTDRTTESPTYVYPQDSEEQPGGVYTVSLTVSDGVNSSTNTTTVTVADKEPTADFSADPFTGPMPLLVHFTDESYSYDGIVTWAWNFGDGSPAATEQNPQHTYNLPGTYTVTLTVTEADGDGDTEIKIDYITVTGTCTTYYRDDDADGYGTTDSQCLYSPMAPYTTVVSGDCDDGDYSVHPGASEICGDGKDNDCDLVIDEDCGCEVNEVPGDLDADCDVDSADYAVFRQSLGKCAGKPGYNPAADYDHDGCVTMKDYRIWYGYYKAYVP